MNKIPKCEAALSDILSITTRRDIFWQRTGCVHSLVRHVAGFPIEGSLSDLKRAAENIARPAILAQCRELEKVRLPDLSKLPADIAEEAKKAWLAEQEKRFGKTISIAPARYVLKRPSAQSSMLVH